MEVIELFPNILKYDFEKVESEIFKELNLQPSVEELPTPFDKICAVLSLPIELVRNNKSSDYFKKLSEELLKSLRKHNITLISSMKVQPKIVSLKPTYDYLVYFEVIGQAKKILMATGGI